jgi:predicted neuraminidase
MRLPRLAVFVCCTAVIATLVYAQSASGPSPVTVNIEGSHALGFADGVVRQNKTTGLSEAYLPIIDSSSHAPNLLLLRNGDVLCFWYTGKWERESGVAVVVSRLKKNTNHWDTPKIIDKREGFAYMNPVAMQDSAGVIHLYHTVEPANGGQETSKLWQLLSADDGKTWSSPQELPMRSGSFTGHSLVALDQSTWLFPLSYQVDARLVLSEIEKTSDGGKLWTACPIQRVEGRMQPSIVMLNPSKFLTYLRSRDADYIYVSTSEDGCNWSPAKPTELPNNDSSIEAKVLKSRHLIMIFNNSSSDRTSSPPQPGLRKPLTAAISEDGGRSWKYVRDIEIGRIGFGIKEQQVKQPGREEYSFPTISQLSDGTILVAYNYRRETIKVVSFHENWVRDGSTIGKFHGRTMKVKPATVQ